MDGPNPVTIGVVNNMSDSSLEGTERQFRELLVTVAGPRPIRLRFFQLPDLPRGDAARAYVREHYQDIAALTSTSLDGLIVTGTEPRSAAIADEPYWTTLVELIDWADAHTTSTIWSCLAAHAAVLHLDGISRHRFEGKISGVFECEKTADHAIVAGLPARWRMPHSRFNSVAGDALVGEGYQIVSASPIVGPDLFLKQGKSLFVFVQGHPEYDSGALAREYQRDVRRFLLGKSEQYPKMPTNYFSAEAAALLTAFRHRARQERHVDLLDEFPAAGIEIDPAATWRTPAERIYANWLTLLDELRPTLSAPDVTLSAAKGRTPPRMPDSSLRSEGEVQTSE